MDFDVPHQSDDECVLHLHPVKAQHTSIEHSNLY